MDGMWKDGRYAVRGLIRSPGFALMAVAIIAVGMGATTAIFSVVHGVLLEPLPVAEPDRLVSVWLENDDGRRARMTPGNFVDLAGTDGVFAHVAAFGVQTASLAADGEPVFLRGSRVTPAYFDALGVQPLHGRGFRPDEGDVGGPAVVVLGHHVWQSAFGSDPAIVGRTVRLDGAPWEVVGVAPPGVYPTHATVSAELPFSVANQDFFVPLRYGPEGWGNRRSHVLGMIGRLAPGVEPAAARAALDVLAGRLRDTEPLNRNERFVMTPFVEEVVGDVRFALLMLMGSVALVLLIAVVNVGALFVLRADDRRPELAIRTALGAPRGRLVRQLLLESAFIAGAASVSALAVAAGSIRLMQRLVPYQVPRLAEVGVEGAALAVTLGLGTLVAGVMGLAPALGLGGRGLAGTVGRGRQTAGRRQRRLHAAVVTVQAALCVVVLVGAVLLARSYAALRAVDTGFDRSAWTMSIPAPPETLEEVVRAVRALPGVAAAAVTYDHPLERNWGDGFLVEGVVRSDNDPPTGGSLRPFGEGYFDAAGIQVVEGRAPDAVDLAGDVAYAVINESLRDAFLDGRPAVGTRITLPTAQRMFGLEGVFEVLGVVRDVRFLGPDQPAGPALYVPLTHFPVNASTLIVRPAPGSGSVLDDVRRAVAEVDASLGVQRAQRLGDVLDDLLARPRFNMMLLLAFGGIGLVLSGLGAYGLVGRVVAMRSREIGIQMALGADRRRLAWSVVGGAVGPVALGGIVGLAAAAGLARLTRSLLFEVSPADPVSFTAALVFVVTVGGVAAVAPTRRALSIDPASALRSD